MLFEDRARSFSLVFSEEEVYREAGRRGGERKILKNLSLRPPRLLAFL
jgi:hypothetical protein